MRYFIRSHVKSVSQMILKAPPVIAPNYFPDRHFETGQIGDFRKDAAQRLITVVGWLLTCAVAAYGA
jgi:hypothetical protein